MDYTLIPASDLIADYLRYYHPKGEPLDESLFYAIADDTVSKITTAQTRLLGIVMLDVKNFTATLPKNYRSDLQAVYRFNTKPRSRQEISQFIKRIPGNQCHLEINVKCPACHQEQCECGNVLYEADVDTIWRMSNPEYTAAASKFFNDYANMNNPRQHVFEDFKFKIMKRTTNNWFSTRYYLGECVDIVKERAMEYKIINGKMITNFEKGEVVLAYLGDHLDKNGYRLIPNLTRVIEAVLTAVAHAFLRKRYFTTLSQDSRMAYQIFSQELETKIRRARDEMDHPSYTELISILHSDWRKMFNPLHWHNAGAVSVDEFNPSNNYNYPSEY